MKRSRSRCEVAALNAQGPFAGLLDSATFAVEECLFDSVEPNDARTSPAHGDGHIGHRQREYAVGRACAQRAFANLGIHGFELVSGPIARQFGRRR